MATLFEAKDEILTAAGAALDALTLPPGCVVPPAGFRYLTPGQPAVDNPCPGQLNVWHSNIRPKPGLTPNKCAYVWEADIEVELWLCSETLDDQGGSPDPAVQTAEVQCLDDILWGVTCALTQSILDRTLLAAVPCENIKLGNAVPLGARGGAAGWKWTLQVQLDCPPAP